MKVSLKAHRTQVHPATIKHLKKGHPWVTLDSYSKNFNKKTPFVFAQDGKENDVALLLNDPFHPQIKARAWSLRPPIEEQREVFYEELKMRLARAYQKREELLKLDERDNIYLCFGEADFLPGLFILRLGEIILIQSNCSFWKNVISSVSSVVCSLLEKQPLEVWYQERMDSKKVFFECLQPQESRQRKKEFSIKEFDISYHIKFGEYYDHGLYTDMASIRKKLKALFENSRSTLNLYSYTGAYSLFALKHNHQEVHSVDLSSAYMSWLEDNIKLNQFDFERHTSHIGDVKKVLEKFKKEEKTFDLIICDPPTSSSDGQKTSNALNDYHQLLTQIGNVLGSKGKAVIFLNTHQVSWGKFEEKIKTYIKGKFLIKEKLQLGEDCPTLKSFPEGNYLKGLVLEKIL